MDELITVEIKATTGSTFELKLPSNGTVDELRWQVARKLQLSRDRLTLIHRDNVVKTGRLADHGIANGSRLTLLPNIEAGFTTSNQGTEQSVVQAIESLSDQQIDDFLSGRDPLTLALRVEDHMMFIQLQLEQQSKEKRKSRHRRAQQQQQQQQQQQLSTPQPGPSGLQSAKSSKSRSKRHHSNGQTIHIPAEAQLSLNQLLAAAAASGAGGDQQSLAALAPLIGLATQAAATTPAPLAPATPTAPATTATRTTSAKPEQTNSTSSAATATTTSPKPNNEQPAKESKKNRPSIYSGTFSGKSRWLNIRN
jgi:uncharacterized ubiquitin-like protein YukD